MTLCQSKATGAASMCNMTYVASSRSISLLVVSARQQQHCKGSMPEHLCSLRPDDAACNFHTWLKHHTAPLLSNMYDHTHLYERTNNKHHCRYDMHLVCYSVDTWHLSHQILSPDQEQVSPSLLASDTYILFFSFNDLCRHSRAAERHLSKLTI